ncbi:UNVERIFIED_CONTAM: protein ApaG [Sesamum angustifolium]|uniref:Protein ApaG n=1 Tax=Sesamum angustifolium TaxID=2727405 RepID=A0AAW2IWM0_9LAMI
MHCLNLKAVANLHSLSSPGRASSGVKDCSFRVNRIVACSVPGSGSGPVQGSSQSPFFSRTETYALLKQQLEVAAKAEDYKEAARLRDSLRVFEEEEPDAARYRDELKEIAPHCLLKCSSDATTWYVEHHKSSPFSGIRVQVRSVYIEGRSQPSKGLYFFAYRIRITNNSDRPVQLLRRHWIITDANGKTESVQGVGVIGEQPVILPKTGFEYSSACPLSTSSGRMEGDFEMKHIDKVGTRTFNVAIAPFALSTFGDGADTT